MGCCSNRLTSLDYSENLLMRIQKELGLSKHKAVFIDRAVHRYSSDFKLSKDQLSFLIKSLEIKNSKNFEDLIENFFFCSNHLHDGVKLSCLGILLGKGEVKEKALLLFQNYDYNMSNSLQVEEVRQMLEDISIICNKILVEIAFEKVNENDRIILENYKKDLMRARKGIVNNFIEIFFEKEENDEINEKDFVDHFNKVDILCLTSPRKFRQYTNKILKTMNIVIRNVELVMKNDEILNSPLYKRIDRTTYSASNKKARIRHNRSNFI